MKYTLPLGLALPLLLIGCNQPPSVDQAEAQFCTDLAQLGGALTELSQINTTSQVSDLRDARQNVANAYQSVRASAETVEAARVNDLETAYENLDATVNGISGRETVGDAATDVATGLAEVRAARDRLNAELACGQ